jgi:hypothetical protein
MRPYALYIRTCPGVVNATHYKVGISALDKIRTRLAAYQQAVGPVWTEKFICIYLGEDIDVKEAEKKIKRHFKSRRLSNEAGLSEWISNISLEEILDYIQELKEKHFIKLENGPEDYIPLTMNNCEDFAAWLADK